ncbi:MAG TPA: response regulator [Bryobacteraceae bacterium]|nr:response regulator [Bryobacteraceae bacterium]
MTTPEATRILVAEDNPADVTLVRLALGAHGVEAKLEVFGHGDLAMEAIEQIPSGGRPDLILMDLNLPGHGGLELLAALRERLRLDVPVVIMTSSSAASDRQAAERLGVSHFFRKPTHLDEFLKLGAVVKRILG